MKPGRLWSPLAAALLLLPSLAWSQEPYKLPPAEVVAILDAPQAPTVRVSPDRAWLVLAQRKNMPSIAELAQPMLRIGGRRINPATNGAFSPRLITGFSVMNVADGSQRPVGGIPGDGWDAPSISPDGRLFSATRDTPEGIELWVGSLADATLRRVLGPELNGARGQACSWTRDSAALLCHVVAPGRGAPPAAPTVPVGPTIQESLGEAANVRTYQDLLGNAHDVALYDYYMTSQPVFVDPASGAKTGVGRPAIYASLELSPSGEYLLTERRVKPYSYVVPDSRFPREVEVWDRQGRVVERLATIPLGESIPNRGVTPGRRDFSWMPGEPHRLLYVEALDGGDPRTSATHRDRLMALEAPFAREGREVARTELRFEGLERTADGLAFLHEEDQATRTVRTWKLDLNRAGATPELLWERNSEDRYGDPGSPVTAANARGVQLVVRDGDWIYLEGDGASDEGDRPFLDRMDVRNGRSERLWQSPPESYEQVVSLLDPRAARLLTLRETRTEPPNYFVVETRGGARRALTSFPDPHPTLSAARKEFLIYRRGDGVQLTATLYLPPEYREGQRVPAVVWAYPREYLDADVAGQVRGSPYRFNRLAGMSHMFFLTQGYAVLDDPTMPILGGDTANDSYVQQLVASGQAAVDLLVERGISERDRIGVGGHSYGAFMTANLLAHSDLFAAGIARSGAYNRTLTPFGFQSEQRRFWEIPEVYMQMSPFVHSDKINEPILLTHGEADNNSGTFPIQSDRMFDALKVHGATVRYISFPNESHGYSARESILHTLAEMIEWFDTYVKKEGARVTTEEGGR